MRNLTQITVRTERVQTLWRFHDLCHNNYGDLDLQGSLQWPAVDAYYTCVCGTVVGSTPEQLVTAPLVEHQVLVWEVMVSITLAGPTLRELSHPCLKQLLCFSCSFQMFHVHP